MTLGIFSVWFLLVIFLRFRWGSAVLTRVFFSCFGGAPPKAFEAGDVASNPAAIRLFWKGRRPMVLYLL